MRIQSVTTNLSTEIHSARADKYIEQVILPFLPGARLALYSTIGFDSDLQLELDLYTILRDSKFQLPLNEDSDFVHFTTITNLFHIIRSKSLWMRDLNSMNDTMEFEFANSYLSPERADSLKSKILSLSLCEFSDATVRNQFMWKEYADDHRGVCLKLRIHKKRGIPPTYQLGKITYHPEDSPIDELIELKKRHDEFKNENGYAISNIDEILYATSSLYKRDCFHKEQEVRLFKTITGNSYPYRNSTQESPLQYLYDTKKKDYRYYMEAPLNNPNEDIIAPHISIEEVILGRNVTDKEFYFLKDIIAEKMGSNFKRDTQITIIRD